MKITLNELRNLVRKILIENPPIDTIINPNIEDYGSYSTFSTHTDDLETLGSDLQKEMVIQFANTRINFVFLFITNPSLMNNRKLSKHSIMHRSQELYTCRKEDLEDRFREELTSKFGNKKIVLIHQDFYDRHSFFELNSPEIIKHDLAHALVEEIEEKTLVQDILDIFEEKMSVILNNLNYKKKPSVFLDDIFYKSLGIFKEHTSGDDQLANIMKNILDAESVQTQEEVFNKFIKILNSSLINPVKEIDINKIKSIFDFGYSKYHKYSEMIQNKLLQNDYIVLLGVNNYIKEVNSIKDLYSDKDF